MKTAAKPTTMATVTPATTMPNHKKLQQYVIGYGLSIVTTLAAYLLVTNRVFDGWALAYAIVGLALVQLLVQLICFLHINSGDTKSEPRWNLLILDFTLLVVVIVVLGSLWIMNHLNYNMVGPDGIMPAKGTSQNAEDLIIKDEGYRK